MKSLTGKFTSVRGWPLLLALLLGAGLMISACGDEEVPTPTTPAPAPAPTPTPTPTPPPDPEPTGPATPTGLRVTAATSNSITWTWNAVEGVLGYQGQFSTDAVFTDAGNTFLIVAPATSHTVQNLSGNTTGYFRVRSGTGTSLTDLSYSDWTDGTPGTTSAPPAAVALDAPDNLRAGTPDNDSVPLTWDEVDDADRYEVQQRADGGSWVAASCDGDDGEVEDTECVASGLDSGTDYDFRVRAVPADDDTANANSAWATLDDAVRTGGASPSTPAVGAGGLNITWRSDADGITWRWDQGADRDYQTKVLRNVLDPESPCEDRHEEWGTMKDFDTSRTQTSPDDEAYLLCARGTYVNSAGEPQYDSPSWAWAAKSPTAPASEAVVEGEDATATEALTWMVSFANNPNIEYEFRFIKDRAATDEDNPETPIDEATCEEQSSVETLNPGGAMMYQTNVALDPYHNYRLCYRAQNASGRSDWSFTTSTLTTLPAAVRAPRASTEQDTTQTEITWKIQIQSGDNIPREAGDFDAKTIAYPLTYTDTSVSPANENARVPTPTVKSCDLGMGDDDAHAQWTIMGPALTTVEGEIQFSYTATRPVNTDPSERVHMCVRAKTDNREGPWTLGGAVTINNQ